MRLSNAAIQNPMATRPPTDAANVITISIQLIFDILGRQVTELISGVQTAGSHSVHWDASSVASGMYFARLVVTDEYGIVQYSKANKLVVMR
jgi:hypothetical protein